MIAGSKKEMVEFARRTLEWRSSYYDRSLNDPVLSLVLCNGRQSSRDAFIAMARDGFQPAHNCLCEMAIFLTEIGDPLPRWLQEYIVSAAMLGSRRRKKGRDPMTYAMRDMVIGQSIAFIADHFGLRATRNAASERTECGCSIVKAALADLGEHKSEAAIAAIWRKDNWEESFRPMIDDE